MRIFHHTLYIICALASLCLSAGSLQAQTLNFETEATGTSLGVYDSWAASPFRMGSLSGFAQVAANPAPGVAPHLGYAPNASAQVAAYRYSPMGSNRCGLRIDLQEPVSMNGSYQYLHTLVYAPVDCHMLVMGLGRDRNYPQFSAETEQFWSLSANTTYADKWTELTFIVYANPAVDIHSLVLVPCPQRAELYPNEFLCYFDQIEINDNPLRQFNNAPYAVNVNESGNQWNTNNYVTSVTLHDLTDGTFQQLDIDQRHNQMVFQDLTSQTLQLTAGHSYETTFKVGSGTPMTGYVYLDRNGDGYFNGSIYEGNGLGDDSDMLTTGPLTNGASLPIFTLPTDMKRGTYRLRFRHDKGTLDPGGSCSYANNIQGNGGMIADVMSQVASAPQSPLRMALFGGSMCRQPGSEELLELWTNELNLQITNKSINGAGFSSLAQVPGIQEEVLWTLQNDEPYDIYLLWASSNDFTRGGDDLGSFKSHTWQDDFSTSALTTMLGGMNRCYDLIRQHAPGARILLLTSLPIFSRGTAGYDPQYSAPGGMRQIVEAEIRWAELHNVPCLDLFSFAGFTPANYRQYYRDDNLHLSAEGYRHIQEFTTQFLSDYRNSTPQERLTSPEAFAGKRVLWLGTSIPQGCTYPSHSTSALGMGCDNHGIGSSFLCWGRTEPPFQRHSGYSLSMSAAEKEALYRPYVLDGTITQQQLDEWKWTSYESRILEGIEQYDVIVIDHGYNDNVPIEADYLRGEAGIDWSSTDRHTFTGAFHYIYDIIHEANPDAVIALGGYFQEQCQWEYLKRGQWVKEVSTWIARHYGIPLIDTWRYTHLTDDGFPTFCPDLVHPWSDPTGTSDRLLDQIVTFQLADRLLPALDPTISSIEPILPDALNGHSTEAPLYYDMQGRPLSQPQPHGVTLIRHADHTFHKVIRP